METDDHIDNSLSGEEPVCTQTHLTQSSVCVTRVHECVICQAPKRDQHNRRKLEPLTLCAMLEVGTTLANASWDNLLGQLFVQC